MTPQDTRFIKEIKTAIDNHSEIKDGFESGWKTLVMADKGLQMVH